MSCATERHSMVETVEHYLQVAVDEFKKIHKPKTSKLKGSYSANAALIFNSWLKDTDMCACDCDMKEHEAVQLVKEFTTKDTLGAVEFYLNMNKEWSYSKLIEHLRTSFKSGKNFSSLLRNFNGQHQKPKQIENHFANELQMLARKVISVFP